MCQYVCCSPYPYQYVMAAFDQKPSGNSVGKTICVHRPRIEPCKSLRHC